MRKIGRIKTISAYLMFTYSILVLFIIGCIIAVTMLFLSRSFKQNASIIRHSLAIVVDSAEKRIDTLRRLTPVVRGNQAITTALLEKKTSSEQMSALNRLYAFGLQASFIITENDQALDPRYASAETAERFLEYTGYYSFAASNHEEMFSYPHCFPFLRPPEENLVNNRISYFHSLRDQNGYQKYGSMLLIVSIDSLFENSATLSSSVFDNICVLDQTGNIIYSMKPFLEETDVSPAAGRAILTAADGERVNGLTVFSSIIPSYPDWRVIAAVSNRVLNQNQTDMIASASIFGSLGILLVILCSHFIARDITRPIKSLRESMEVLESGAFPGKVAASSSGEMAALTGGFNHMLDKLRDYMDSIVREQEQKRLAEITALRYQLLSLQNQINPHFLYNTLNTISFLALEGKTEQIREFNQLLISLLRSTLSGGQEAVSVSQEISLLHVYTRLMEFRYPDMFTIRMEVDESAKKRLIPKFILQPIVENAMLHGILPSGRAGAVTITVREADGMLRIEVADNGVGMDEKEILSMYSLRKGLTGIGLNNVNDQLRLFYGEASGIRVSSVKGAGTIISFLIPAADVMPDKTGLETAGAVTRVSEFSGIGGGR